MVGWGGSSQEGTPLLACLLVIADAESQRGGNKKEEEFCMNDQCSHSTAQAQARAQGQGGGGAACVAFKGVCLLAFCPLDSLVRRLRLTTMHACMCCCSVMNQKTSSSTSTSKCARKGKALLVVVVVKLVLGAKSALLRLSFIMLSRASHPPSPPPPHSHSRPSAQARKKQRAKASGSQRLKSTLSYSSSCPSRKRQSHTRSTPPQLQSTSSPPYTLLRRLASRTRTHASRASTYASSNITILPTSHATFCLPSFLPSTPPSPCS